MEEETSFLIKKIDFLGDKVSIVIQANDGPCSLIVQHQQREVCVLNKQVDFDENEYGFEVEFENEDVPQPPQKIPNGFEVQNEYVRKPPQKLLIRKRKRSENMNEELMEQIITEPTPIWESENMHEELMEQITPIWESENTHEEPMEQINEEATPIWELNPEQTMQLICTDAVPIQQLGPGEVTLQSALQTTPDAVNDDMTFIVTFNGTSRRISLHRNTATMTGFRKVIKQRFGIKRAFTITYECAGRNVILTSKADFKEFVKEWESRDRQAMYVNAVLTRDF